MANELFQIGEDQRDMQPNANYDPILGPGSKKNLLQEFIEEIDEI